MKTFGEIVSEIKKVKPLEGDLVHIFALVPILSDGDLISIKTSFDKGELPKSDGYDIFSRLCDEEINKRGI